VGHDGADVVRRVGYDRKTGKPLPRRSRISVSTRSPKELWAAGPRPLRVRRARRADAAAIARMANALNRHEGLSPRAFTAAIVRRDAFGPKAIFRSSSPRWTSASSVTPRSCRATTATARLPNLWMLDLWFFRARRQSLGRALVRASRARRCDAGSRVSNGACAATTRAPAASTVGSARASVMPASPRSSAAHSAPWPDKVG